MIVLIGLPVDAVVAFTDAAAFDVLARAMVPASDCCGNGEEIVGRLALLIVVDTVVTIGVVESISIILLLAEVRVATLRVGREAARCAFVVVFLKLVGALVMAVGVEAEGNASEALDRVFERVCPSALREEGGRG
jgi:hypothetical protein